MREVLDGDGVGLGLREEWGARALESLMKWTGVYIKELGDDAEGRALGTLKIDCPFHCPS